MGTHWTRVIVVAAGLTLGLAPHAGANPIDPGPVPTPVPAVSVEPASALAPSDGVPHLPSPDNLPPGATQTAPEHPNLSYLREIWQAVRSQNVTMSDALLLIAQRPMDASSP